MRVPFRAVLGVDWFEFGADFGAGTDFFVVLGMAPLQFFLLGFFVFFDVSHP